MKKVFCAAAVAASAGAKEGSVFLPEVQNEVAVGAVQLRPVGPVKKGSVMDFVSQLMTKKGEPTRGAADAAPHPPRRGSPQGDGLKKLTPEEVVRRLRLRLKSPTSAGAKQRAASGNTSESGDSSVGELSDSSANSRLTPAARRDDREAFLSPDDRLEHDFEAIEQRLRFLSTEATAQLDHSWDLYCHKRGLRLDEDSWKSFLAMREENGGTDFERRKDDSLPVQQLKLSPPDDDALLVEVLSAVGSSAFWRDWQTRRAEMHAKAKAEEFDKATEIQKGLTTLLRAEMQATEGRLEHLEKLKQDAVRREEFGAAAKIRDEIRRRGAAAPAPNP